MLIRDVDILQGNVCCLQQAHLDNERRRKLENSLYGQDEMPMVNPKKEKKVQEAMVSELKQRNRQIKEKKLLNKDEVYHGALEDILLGKAWLFHFNDLRNSTQQIIRVHLFGF